MDYAPLTREELTEAANLFAGEEIEIGDYLLWCPKCKNHGFHNQALPKKRCDWCRFSFKFINIHSQRDIDELRAYEKTG